MMKFSSKIIPRRRSTSTYPVGFETGIAAVRPGSPSRHRWGNGWFYFLLLVGSVAGVPRAQALDPQRRLTQYQSRRWGPEQGLPCNNVLSIIQGSDGYLWIGTEEGLVRFDGVRIQVFDHQTDPALIGNSVYSVHEDSRHPGQLLLGSAAGVCRFTGGKVQTYQPQANLDPFPGVVLYLDPLDDSLWVRTPRGLFHVSSEGTTTGPAEATSGWPTEKIRAVCRDASGRLWVGSVGGLYRQRMDGPGALVSLEPVPDWSGKGVEYLKPARGGGIWVGSRAGGTGRLDAAGIFRPRPELAGCGVNIMLEDRAGMLWVGTEGSGLFRQSAADGAKDEPGATDILTTETGLLHNLVNGLCEDREGNLWIASQMGLQVLRDARFVNFGRPEGLAGDDVRTIFEDAHEQVWIGNENGLGKLDPTGARITNYPVPFSPMRPGNSRVLCVGRGEDDDSVWAGTISGLVRWRAGQLEPLPLRDDLDRSAIRALCEDAAGNRWVGTNNGLYQVRDLRVQARFTSAEGLSHDIVRALYTDPHGDLWIATGGGLSRREPNGRITNFLDSGPGRGDGTVLSFFKDPTGTGDLFVGTDFGLHRLHFDRVGEVKIIRYTTANGLFDDVIWSLLGDARGNLWMSSNKGISRVTLADLDRFDRGAITRIPCFTYGIGDGMRSRECNGGHQPAAWRDHVGQLWFATVRGAVRVDPAHVESHALPPPVHVEEILAEGLPLLGAGENAPDAAESVFQVVPGTQKLSFRYTALSLVAPEGNRFRYRLEGFDHGWTDAGLERVARYTNLPPGQYRFAVQAANSDGVWSTRDAVFSFHLRPFFYQTAWFRALVLAATVGLGWVVWWRIRRRWHQRFTRAEDELRERARTQEILRQAMEEAESGQQIARQARSEAEAALKEAERANSAKGEFLSRLSHELRTPLNAILGFGQLLEMEALTTAQFESVGHIMGGGKNLLGLVDEILDLSRVERGTAEVHSEEFSAATLLQETLQLVEPIARERGIELKSGSPPRDIPNVLADRHRLKQVLRNLLENGIKYNRSPGGEVFAEVLESPISGPEGPQIRIAIRDTGIGIAPEGVAKLFTPFERLGAAYGPIEGTGLGLVLSRQLVEAMKGSIGVESSPGIGSTFWVELPAAKVPTTIPGVDLASMSPPTHPPREVSSESDLPHPGSSGVDQPGVLYIEDNASNRQLLESIFNQHRPDLRLHCAPDGQAGLAAAGAEPQPSLILLDLQLPDLPGDEVLSRLRANTITANIPAIVLSADATAGSLARLKAAGAADYLTKPLELPQLLKVLAGHFPPDSSNGRPLR